MPHDITVMNLNGQEVGRIPLEPVWEQPVNRPLLLQALAMYRTNTRRTIASTKTRGDVSGGGKKPWKQKHTGRARAGSTRSPLWRHGGSVFGPRPRHVHYRLPQTIRAKALLESLKGKLQNQELVVLDQLAAAQPKTKPFAGLAKTFSVTRRSLIVLHEPTEATIKSLRNLKAFTLSQADSLNAYDVLNTSKVFVTQPAFEQLWNRVKSHAPSH